jgi:hypothetical protein
MEWADRQILDVSVRRQVQRKRVNHSWHTFAHTPDIDDLPLPTHLQTFDSRRLDVDFSIVLSASDLHIVSTCL